MATTIYYTGPRPVLRGRNAKNNINPYTGKVENYSNWSIFNTEHVFDGYPETNHIPGSGLYPHGLKLSRLFTGKENNEQPLKNSGIGPRQLDGRYGPLLNRAAGNAKVFKSAYGHLPDTPVFPSGQLYWYSNYVFHGLRQLLLNPGHIERKIGATGTANTFGEFIPDNPDPSRKNPLTKSGYGQTVPATHDTDPYGHNKVNEWFGVRKIL